MSRVSTIPYKGHGMNFRQLDCFMEVASQLSFSKAAEHLFLSQSAVSQQVISLENEIGFQLFIRDKRQVMLTVAGEFLFQRFSKMRPSFEEALEEARYIAQSTPVALSIGYDGGMTGEWFFSTVRRFHTSYPGSFLKMRRKPAFFLTDLLLNGSLDMIVTYNLEIEDHPNIKYHPLLETYCCAFVPASHPLSLKNCIQPADLKGEVLLADSYSDSNLALTKWGQHFKKLGVDFSKAHPVSDGDVITSLVEAGLGIFLASHVWDGFMKNRNVVAVELDIGDKNWTLGIAWKQDSRKVDDFIALARDVLKNDQNYMSDYIKLL
jgi:DNA-binding transcriptional LysR family regulator